MAEALQFICLFQGDVDAMLSPFFEEVSRLPGVDVLDRPQAEAAYGQDTGGSERFPAGAIVVRAAGSIREVLALANKHKTPLWPISGGRNFGYGTSLPVDTRSFILDLSGLRAVQIDVDSCTA